MSTPEAEAEAEADRPGRLLARVGPPVLSQAITAGTSLLLQVVAAHTLELPEFGAFALFLALLVSASALHTGFVGDGLVVLDRHDPDVRAGLAASAGAGLLLAGAVGIGAALVIGSGDPAVALLYPAMLVLWLVEETVRRLLVARRWFWRLVGNDVAYLVGTALALGAGWAWAGAVSLPLLFAAMAVGAVTAVGVGVLQLPRAELRVPRPRLAALPRVVSFAGWRALQAALRPAALLAARALVANLVSLAAVGVLEAGRLVVAPLQVVVNGVGTFLLSAFAARARSGRTRPDRASRAALLLTAGTAAGGGLLALLAAPLGRLLTGEPAGSWLVLGWVAYLVVWSAGLPYVALAVAARLTRAVFTARAADSLLGVALAAAALALGAPLAAVPWLMAAGGLYSVWRLRAHTSRPTAPLASTQQFRQDPREPTAPPEPFRRSPSCPSHPPP
ncbi:Membrane protein involved in the export of O-antigen and teichoic acid [Amycolatopsis arida]|uniref:Membrane protein involved in the export of O-antigen and teichoic acid n=1 Tax=Amycolatopsis arida TaxID=587909 RepID=A0A1I5Z6L7_9PSEU|nr:hypothetical protein [Amycolatopsis arida]TDX90182.1 O-antigen/teichoic acid export membrane protein [Amycolatopsis arida]SFQ52112.1 Membrane protein involved in the export of O-antigen and teichoic acid [Amycolatopsis arida]